MSHIHLSLGNDLLRAEVRAHVACLANQLPNAEFNLVVTGAALAALLGNTGDLMVNTPVLVAAPASTGVGVNLAAPAAPAPAAPASTGERFRRTKEETEAGLSVEEAKFFRQSGGGDPVAYKAGLTKSEGAAPTVPTTTVDPGAAAPAEAPPAEAPKADGPVVVTEQDVRDAAAKAVQCKRVADVKQIAADYGVANWKELDASKYPEVLAKLTALIVVG